jgi:hypothetical protein
MAATATPSVARAYVAPGGDGIAHGTPADEDIFATGPGQTLLGGGGNDIFHLGSFNDATVVPGSGGITEVATWAGSYTLPAGVDNLSANGDNAHTLIGNDRDNFIVGAGGNDTLDGGLGNDVLIGGGGRDTFIETAGNGSDTAHFVVGAGGDVMNLNNYGYTSFDDVKAHMTALTGGGTLLSHPNGETTLFLNDGAESIRDVTPNNFTADNFILNGAVTTPPPTTGSDSLVLHLSEDAFQGDAQFRVLLDGNVLANGVSVTTPHGSGFQDFTFNGAFGAGPHTVEIQFLNDAYAGSPSTDRNLYVGGVTFDGRSFGGETAFNNAMNGQPDADPNAAEMYVNGSVIFNNVTGGSGPPPPPSGTTSTIVLHVSEDAFQGDAQFNVRVDGAAQPATLTAHASHAAGAVDDITITGDFGAQGPGTVDIQFLNDAYGGTPSTDRNLYVQSIDVNGVHFQGNTASNDAANGHQADDPSAAVMDINGTATFNINHTAPPLLT